MLAAQLQALAGSAGGGQSVLEAACGVLLAGYDAPDGQVFHVLAYAGCSRDNAPDGAHGVNRV